MGKKGFFPFGKELILTDKWDPVDKFFGAKYLEWLVFFFLSPIWILVKVFVTFGLWIYRQVKHWPWFFIRFIIFELVLVTTDVGSDTAQGIRLMM